MMTFFYPNCSTPTPPGDQLRVRHRRFDAIGWTRATNSDRSVVVDFDGDRFPTTCLWADLETFDDVAIPAMPDNVVRLPVLFRVSECWA